MRATTSFCAGHSSILLARFSCGSTLVPSCENSDQVRRLATTRKSYEICTPSTNACMLVRRSSAQTGCTAKLASQIAVASAAQTIRSTCRRTRMETRTIWLSTTGSSAGTKRTSVRRSAFAIRKKPNRHLMPAAELCADPFVGVCSRVCPFPHNTILDQGEFFCGKRCGGVPSEGEFHPDRLVGFNSAGSWSLTYSRAHAKEWCEVSKIVHRSADRD